MENLALMMPFLPLAFLGWLKSLPNELFPLSAAFYSLFYKHLLHPEYLKQNVIKCCWFMSQSCSRVTFLLELLMLFQVWFRVKLWIQTAVSAGHFPPAVLCSVIVPFREETAFWELSKRTFCFVVITSKQMTLFPYRLRSMLKLLEERDVDFEEIKKNLDFTASLLEAIYLDGTR